MKYPACFEICGLAKEQYDELVSKKNTKKFQELMKLYSDVFCVEMGKKSPPYNVKLWLKDSFTEGRFLVKELGGNVKRHNDIEKIHTPRILRMYKN